MSTRWTGSLLLACGLAAVAVIGTSAQTTTTYTDRLVVGGDTNLYRSAADVLKTDDFFQAGGGTYGWGIGAVADIPRIYYSAGIFVLINASNADADLEVANALFTGTLLRPNITNTTDLASSTYKWKDGWFAGTLNTGPISIAGDVIPTTSNSRDLGSSTYKLKDLWVAGTVNTGPISVAGDIKPTTGASRDLGDGTYTFRYLYFEPETTDGADYPLVYATGNKKPYYKTDGVDTSPGWGGLTLERGLVTAAGTITAGAGDNCATGGGWIETLNVTSGIVTGWTCGYPAQGVTAEQLASLVRDVAALRAEVAALKAAERRQ